MRRLPALICFAAILLARASTPAAMQGTTLTIVSSGPSGEVRRISDAHEVRVIFSEPMVALGRIPSNPVVPWITITPAIKGSFRWSGTTILIFTPDPATPLPYATRYAVAIDTKATSAAGHALASPYRFEFITPTVQLESAEWYRKTGLVNSPAVIALRFNQPVNATDIVRHLKLNYAPHDWDAPKLSDDARRRMAALDPAGPKRFDDKVAATMKAAQASGAVTTRIATDWDKKRFPPADELVVIETTTAPRQWKANPRADARRAGAKSARPRRCPASLPVHNADAELRRVLCHGHRLHRDV